MIAALFLPLFAGVVVFAGQPMRNDSIEPYNVFAPPFIAVGERLEPLDPYLEEMRKKRLPVPHVYSPSKKGKVYNKQKMELYKLIPSLQEYIAYRDAYEANPQEKKGIAGAVAVQIAGDLLLEWPKVPKKFDKETWNLIKAVCFLRVARIDDARSFFDCPHKHENLVLVVMAARGLCACDLVEGKVAEAVAKAKETLLVDVSHELRTPLNSLLIFAQLLSENKEKNLKPDQVESAKMIFKSGQDLLNLITDILDLSKAEAGKLNINVSRFTLDSLLKDLTDNFNIVAREKALTFKIVKSYNVVENLNSDSQRILQILRNLLSNAFKFTEKGSVTLTVSMVGTDIQFAVKDTGIGIPNDKLQEIFNAFQQADGSITRKYGGTGLGLNISRKMTNLLAGSLLVQSELGVGSVFTLRIPCQCEIKSKALTLESLEKLAQEREDIRELASAQMLEASRKIIIEDNSVTINDDIESISINDRSILVIEDDMNFSKILVDMIHKNNYKVLIAKTGQAGFELAKKHLPSAIILDINLPDVNGISVLQMLKTDNKTNGIPVHIISAIDLKNNPFINHEAIGYLRKPVSLDDITSTISKIELSIKNQIKNILVVEDDPGSCKALEMLLTQKHMHASFAKNGRIAKEMLISNRYDCVILDLTLPDTTGLDLLEELNNNHTIRLPALIVYTGKSLSRDEYNNLSKYTSSIVIKGEKSSERLLDELSLFLTSLTDEENLTDKHPITETATSTNKNSKTILLVDDDMRNNMALSKVLSLEGINILLADNGKAALEQLNKHKEINLVVMDIMMPEMDGYQAIEQIRTQPEYKDTPIIALTANAMPGTKEKCLSVGASDYLTKPIEINELLSLINLHLYEQRAAG